MSDGPGCGVQSSLGARCKRGGITKKCVLRMAGAILEGGIGLLIYEKPMKEREGGFY